ncbi:hypothetical protein STEG23_033249 [Scotinomys teguina]
MDIKSLPGSGFRHLEPGDGNLNPSVAPGSCQYELTLADPLSAATQPQVVSSYGVNVTLSFCGEDAKALDLRATEVKIRERGFTVENDFSVNNEKCVVEDYKPNCSMETSLFKVMKTGVVLECKHVGFT